MRSPAQLVLALAAAVGSAAIAAPLAVSPNITAALASPDRPAADTARDGVRKPGDVIAFSGMKPGWLVADYIPGTGYYDRVFAAVVGPKGHVYGFYPTELKAIAKVPLPPDGATPDA